MIPERGSATLLAVHPSVALLIFALGTEAVDLASYVTLERERTWVYRAADETTVTVALERASAGGEARWVRTSSDGSRRVESFDSEDGFRLHSLVLAGGDVLDYERPVVWLPPGLEAGEAHESQRRFVRRSQERKVDVGAHAYETELLGFESVDTPMRRFEDCLKLRFQAVRMDFSGSVERTEATEWYAKGVGLVRTAGTRTISGASGEVLENEDFELVLTSIAAP